MVSIPYGKGKVNKNVLSVIDKKNMYQFPMGKVKASHSKYKRARSEKVSIPYGKGKDEFLEDKEDAEMLYQFPM